MKKYKLSEISLNITDGEHGTVEDDSNGKYYLLSCKNIKNGNIHITSNDRIINEETFNKIQKRIKLEKEDVLITTVGTIGEMSIIKNNTINYCFQRSVGIIKPDKQRVNPHFLYYSLKNELEQINRLVKGAVQKCLFINDMKNIEIKIPELEIQNIIVTILSSIDKKIELNNQINDNLFEILRQYIKENYYNNLSIEIKAVKNIGKIQGGYAFKSKDLLDESTQNKIFKIKNISSNGIDIENTQFIYDEIAEKMDKKFLLTRGNVIIAMTGAELGKTGYMYGNEHRYFLNQRVGVVRGNDIFTELYLNCIFLQDDMQNKLNSKGYGSAQPNISATDIENIEIPIPEENQLKEFYEVCNPIYNNLILNSEQNQYLSQLRDTILPKLMNGEIDLDKINI